MFSHQIHVYVSHLDKYTYFKGPILQIRQSTALFPAVPEFHSTHTEHVQLTETVTAKGATDMDIDSLHTIFDACPMDNDSDYTSHDPWHNPDKALPSSHTLELHTHSELYA